MSTNTFQPVLIKKLNRQAKKEAIRFAILLGTVATLGVVSSALIVGVAFMSQMFALAGVGAAGVIICAGSMVFAFYNTLKTLKKA